MRPVTAMRAFLARREREEAWQVYVAEQLWMVNCALYHNDKMARFRDLIEGTSTTDAQKASDEKEKTQVHDWLMGGDSYGSIYAGGAPRT